MHYNITCLYCGQSNRSSNYCCTCHDKSWLQRYRSLDIEFELNGGETAIVNSYKSYSFEDPKGILQYKMLPCLNFATNLNNTTGLTPLHSLTNFGNGNRDKIYLKDEGQNPSGCFKDRETLLCKLHSKYQNLNKAVIYSSGNAAASAATFVENSPRSLVTFVPGDTYPEKVEYIRNHGSDVIIIGDKKTSFEDGYCLFSQMNAENIFVENGFDNWSVRNPYRVQGDKTIALEIVKQLSDGENAALIPDYVVVPTANGSCLAGIWKGFKELKKLGIISQLPKMVSTGIKNANPVYKAVHQNKTEEPTQCNLSNVDDDNAEVGSIILAEEGYDSIEAAKAVLESGGTAVALHASDIRQTLIDFLDQESDLALTHAILPEPASLTSLAALEKIDNKISHSNSEIFVCISTGHGIKAQKKISKLLADKPQLQDIVNRIVAKREQNISDPATKKGKKVSVEADIESITASFLNLQKQPVYG